ncbi:MAG: hypothetical protein SNJ52_01210 [Verrucomicrobiia bacterium]
MRNAIDQARVLSSVLWVLVFLVAVAGLAVALLPPRPILPGSEAIPLRENPPIHSIWSGLILATLQSHPQPLPTVLAPFEEGLKANFGYDQYVILAETESLLTEHQERWFVPSEQTYLSTRLVASGDEGPTIAFQVFQKNKLLLEGEARMVNGEPLFIKGPPKGHGQLIFAIIAK